MKLLKLALILAALCSGAIEDAAAQIRYVGSDTVEPLIEAAHGSFLRGHRDSKLQIQANGSSSGLRELCTGRAMLAGSSRPIKAEEQRQCTAAGVAVTELPLAVDAVAVIVSSKNTWLKDMTIDEIKHVFSPSVSEKLTSWKQVRAGLPEVPLKTVGVGIKHGTFQFFTEAIGNGQFVRSDFKDTHDHAETIKLVQADPGAIGFVPLGTVKDFHGQVRAVAIDFGKGPVDPVQVKPNDGRYVQFSRQIYLYVNSAGLAKPSAEKDFVAFLIGDLERYVNYANLLPLQPMQYQETMQRAKSLH